MEKFFVPSKIWKDGGPFPHLLVLLGEYPEFREYARAHHDLLTEYSEHLGVIPEEWLHSTVQGIHHTLDDAQMAKLRGTLHDELAGMQPFQVQLGPIWPGITAVTVAVYPEDGMAALNDRVRTAAEKVPAIALRPREARFWAHASLSYARDDFPDRDLNRALRALRPRAWTSRSTASTSSTSTSTRIRATTPGTWSRNSHWARTGHFHEPRCGRQEDRRLRPVARGLVAAVRRLESDCGMLCVWGISYSNLRM